MVIDRRKFLKVSGLTIVGATILPGLSGCIRQRIRFGWVTDVHYAQAPIKWGRYFQESCDKLKEAVQLFNQVDIDFAIETGDFKDQNEPPEKRKTVKYLEAIEREYAKFKGPRYHVLGNHDLDSLSKPEFQSLIENTGIPSKSTFYWFETGGYRFVALDACYRTDGAAYDNGNFKWNDTAIPDFELSWLQKALQESELPVVVFTHQLLDGEGDLYVANANAVRLVLEKSSRVFAVFQGHKHEGDYNFINGIHYFTQKAMVDGTGAENSSYSVVELSEDGNIVIEGYRKAESFSFQPETV